MKSQSILLISSFSVCLKSACAFIEDCTLAINQNPVGTFNYTLTQQVCREYSYCLSIYLIIGMLMLCLFIFPFQSGSKYLCLSCIRIYNMNMQTSLINFFMFGILLDIPPKDLLLAISTSGHTFNYS